MKRADPDLMTEARIKALAEAFGADLSRWPEAEREAARVLRFVDPQAFDTLLDDARGLDGLLDTWKSPGPAETLRHRVVAQAAGTVRTARRRSLVLTLGGGASLAAACLAGVLVAPRLLALPEPAPEVAAISADMETGEVLNQVFTGWDAPLTGAEAGQSS